MAATKDDIGIHEYDASLNQVGNQWGNNPDPAILAESVGQEEWFETVVPGVIGLNGNNPGKGPGIIIRDIESSDIDMVWTAGLIGCMGLFIIGRDAAGQTDLFACHARHYNSADAITAPDNPMHLARQFVDTHQDVRVFWGTDFFFGERDVRVAIDKRNTAQQQLSNELGIWVRDSDCVVSKEHCFLPKLALLKDDKPKAAYDWVKSEEAAGRLAPRVRFSKSKCLTHFTPDKDILGALDLKQTKIRMDRAAKPRMIHQDNKRDTKLQVLHQVINAYHSGNFDILRYFAEHAKAQTAPYADSKSVNAWASSGESETATLCIRAYEDALAKIRAYEITGCGIRPDGQRIFDVEEFDKRFDAALEESRGEGAHP